MNAVNIVRPISTHYLHIRSKDATQLVDGFNTDFQVQLQSAITSKPDQEIHISLSSLEMPYSFYNISSDLDNNTFVFKRVFLPDTTVTIPDGNYSIDDLVSTFNADASFSAKWSMTFSYTTGKVTLTSSDTASILVKWSESTINKVLGYREGQNDETVTAGSSTTSPFICNLATVHSLYIKANFAASNVQSTRQGSSSTIQKVSVDVNSGGVIYLDSRDHIQTTRISNPVVDLLQLRITDQNDRLIQLNNCNYELSLMFQIFPRNHTPTDLASKRVVQQQSIAMPLAQPRDLIRTQPALEIDDSHPIEGTPEASHKTKRLILDDLLDRIAQ